MCVRVTAFACSSVLEYGVCKSALHSIIIMHMAFARGTGQACMDGCVVVRVYGMVCERVPLTFLAWESLIRSTTLSKIKCSSACTHVRICTFALLQQPLSDYYHAHTHTLSRSLSLSPPGLRFQRLASSDPSTPTTPLGPTEKLRHAIMCAYLQNGAGR